MSERTIATITPQNRARIVRYEARCRGCEFVGVRLSESFAADMATLHVKEHEHVVDVVEVSE